MGLRSKEIKGYRRPEIHSRSQRVTLGWEGGVLHTRCKTSQ